MSIENPVVAIVDDNIIDAELIATILRGVNLPSWVCYSAESFYREALRRKFDILIIDIILPGENGLSCVRHMNNRDDIVSIVVSGSTEENMYLQALDAGAEMFLSKPIRRQDLLAATQLALKKLESQTRSGPRNFALRLHPASRILTSQKGVEAQLTPLEAQLLLLLSSKAGEIVPKLLIAEHLQLSHLGNPGHRIEVILSRLRKKLYLKGIELPIKSISGQGKTCSEEITIVD